MKLTDLFESNAVADLQAELKKLNKELVDAKGGGNDAMIERLRDDIRRTKEKIEDAKAMEE